MLVLGLMSGTSADGVDAALVEWPEGEALRPFRLVAFHHAAFPADLQARIHGLAAGRVAGPEALRELAALDVLLGERFADAALAALERAGVPPERVQAIASHGQTVAHHPELGASLQIADPSRIAERTGCTVVADFRARDLAVGGEGAPLAPFFHWAVFSDATENRVALNLGGIANLTWLPRQGGAEAVIAFDVGPANALVDSAVAIASDGAERMDRDGARALRGRVDAALLAELLDDDFLRRPPPKSTGRERYGTAEAERLVEASRRAGRSLDDLVATLVRACAEAVARACRDFLGAGPGAPEPLARLLVGGGGAANPAVLAELGRAFPQTRVEPFDAAGVPIQAAEAMAFSLLGRNALLGLPNHLPRCTGASAARVLGEVAPGQADREPARGKPA